MNRSTVFLYDGDCAFCSKCADFIDRRVDTPASVQPWQWSDLEVLGVSADQCDAAVQWVSPGEPIAAGPDAIARLLRSAGGRVGVWKLMGAVLSLPPVRRLAWPAYRWVARNRHRMPGGTAACSLSQAQREAGKATA